MYNIGMYTNKWCFDFVALRLKMCCKMLYNCSAMKQSFVLLTEANKISFSLIAFALSAFNMQSSASESMVRWLVFEHGNSRIQHSFIELVLQRRQFVSENVASDQLLSILCWNPPYCGTYEYVMCVCMISSACVFVWKSEKHFGK